MSELQIQKASIKQTRIVDSKVEEDSLAFGEILLKIDKFGLSANNISYAVIGEQFAYWQFFPPHLDTNQVNSDSINQWGVLPVWGYAEVIESRSKDVSIGERVFGYFPVASQLLTKVAKVSDRQWYDASEHRAKLPSAYNVYRKVAPASQANSKLENLHMLLFPLHITSFALLDYFSEQAWFKASQVVLLSASSKTALGLAYGIDAMRKNDHTCPKSIALTSSRNIDMLAKLATYQVVLSYEDIQKIDNTVPTLLVDMSGNSQVLNDVHAHLGDNMKFCSKVGLTHHEKLRQNATLFDERTEVFFAPSQIQKRIKEWGPQGFEEKSAAFLNMTIARSQEWLQIKELKGLEELNAIFAKLCDGDIPAQQALVVKM